MVTNFDSKISISPDVMIRRVGEESVLLDLKSDRYLGLDEVGTRMWQVLSEAESIETARQSLLVEFDVDAERLSQDLDDFVQELLRLELIEVGNKA